jgi:AcrR family transcriptional regulator
MELDAPSVSQPSLRERHKQATRRELREAALDLFERHGYAHTSVDQIAHAAGVSRSTFFRYFASKEEVLALESREGARLFLKMLAERPDHEGRLRALEETLVEFAHAQRTDERREELQRMEAIVSADPSLSAARTVLIARWREEVAKVLASRAGREQPDLEDALASAILSQMTEQIGMRWRTAESAIATTDVIRSSFAALRRLVAG